MGSDPQPLPQTGVQRFTFAVRFDIFQKAQLPGENLSRRPLVIQFNLADGEARETGPGTGIFDGAFAAGDPCFYVFAVTVPPGDKYVSERLVAIAEDAFSLSRASLTSRLRRAVSEAQRWLSEENRKRLPEDRVAAGLACIAVQGDSLYLAQAGPSVAYLLSTEGLRLIRSDGPPLGGPDPFPTQVGMGRDSDDVNVTLSRRALGPSDILLLASSSLERVASPETMARLLRAGPEEAMQRLYLAVVGERHFSALLIAPGESAAHPPTARKVRAAGETWWRRIWRWFSPMLAVLWRLVLPVLRGLLSLLLYPFVVALDFIAAIARGIRSLLILEEEEQSQIEAPQAAPRTRQGATPGPRGRAINLPLIAVVILAILVAGGLGALYLPGFLAQQAEIRFATLLTQSEVLYQRGTAAADRDEARKHFREASRQADNALAIHADDSRALDVRAKLDTALEKVDALFQLSEVRMALDGASTQPVARELRRVLVQDNVIYLFDRAANGVYAYSLDADGNPKTLESPGFMSAASDPAREVVDMFAAPAGDTRFSGGIMFLDRNRSLNEYDLKRGSRPLAVRNAGDWASFQAARTYGGNLYVLDSKARQVWRYIPTDAGYDSEMKPLLEDVDMGEAFDFAIDGNVYVLNRLGQVFKFSNGQLQSFKQQGLDKPLSNPSAIFTAADAKSVYIADTGNKRVVTFDKDGKFQRQLVSNVIDSPRSIFVDERRGRIYILSGNKLYLAGLPK